MIAHACSLAGAALAIDTMAALALCAPVARADAVDPPITATAVRADTGCPTATEPHPGGPPLYTSRGPDDGDLDIWYLARSERGYLMPTRLPSPINTDAGEYCPAWTADGSLLFVSTRSGRNARGTGSCPHGVVYVAPKVAGTDAWLTPMKLGCATASTRSGVAASREVSG